MVDISASLRRAARRTEGLLSVLIRSSAPADVTMAAVRAVVAAAEASTDAVDMASPLEVQATTKGPAVVLTDADPVDMLPVLERLAERLGEAGLTDATLTLLPRTNPYGRNAEEQMAAIKCWMVLRGQRPDGWAGLKGWDLNRGVWDVNAEDTRSALEELVEWAVSLPKRGAAAAVSSVIDSWVPVPLTEVLGFMRRTQENLSWINVNQLMVTAGGEFRSVDLYTNYGLAAAATGVRNGAVLDWHRAVDDTQELVVTAGPWCEHAHLTRGHSSTSTSVLQPDGDRHIGNPWTSRHEDWAEWISSGRFFDAYAIMRLPVSAQSLVEPLWHVSQLPTGHILAEHPHPTAWFDLDHIDSDVLDRARSVLGEAVIDRSGERIDNW